MNIKLLIVLLFGLFSFPLIAQVEVPGPGTTSPDEINVDSVKSDFNERFKLSEDKTNFKKLRDYRSEKENLILANEAKLKILQADIKTLEEDIQNIQNSTTRLRQRVDNSNDTVFTISGFFNFPNASKYLLSIGLSAEDTKGNKKMMSEVIYPKLAELINNQTKKLKSLNDKYNVIKYNTNNAQTDLNLCLSTIDDALAPEYKELQTKIGLGYTVLITLGLIILLIIVGIMIDKIKIDTIKMLISDGGLQFVTIFVLMIAIILFGILNILEGKELAAILAGVSGYILGRGSRVVSDKKEEKDTKPAKEESAKETKK